MRLKLVLCAGAREAAGIAEAQLDFEEAELDTAALLVKLEAAYPKLAELLPRCALACNGEYADGLQPLADGDEVAERALVVDAVRNLVAVVRIGVLPLPPVLRMNSSCTFHA